MWRTAFIQSQNNKTHWEKIMESIIEDSSKLHRQAITNFTYHPMIVRQFTYRLFQEKYLNPPWLWLTQINWLHLEIIGMAKSQTLQRQSPHLKV